MGGVILTTKHIPEMLELSWKYANSAQIIAHAGNRFNQDLSDVWGFLIHFSLEQVIKALLILGDPKKTEGVKIDKWHNLQDLWSKIDPDLQEITKKTYYWAVREKNLQFTIEGHLDFAKDMNLGCKYPYETPEEERLYNLSQN